MFNRRLFSHLAKASAPSQEFKAALRVKLLGQAYPRRSAAAYLQYSGSVMILALAVIFGLGGYAYASPSVHEESTLYPLKSSLEHLEARFHKDPLAKERFEQRLQYKRLEEVRYFLGHHPEISDRTLIELRERVKALPSHSPEKQELLRKIEDRIQGNN